MKEIESDKLSLSTAAKTGLVAFLLATILIIVDGWLAVIPLAGFLLLCLTAPFFPRFGFYFPVICKGASGKKVVAITFGDDAHSECSESFTVKHIVTSNIF